jgi:hypothetical protein
MSGKRFLVPCILLLMQQSTLAAEPEERLETPLALAFGAPPTIGDPMLSPDGARLLFTQQNPQGVSMLQSLDFEDGTVSPIVQGTEDGYAILWCAFAGETRVLCDLRQGPPDATPDYQRFVAVNTDGSELTPMRQATGCRDFNKLRDDPNIDRLADDEGQIQFLCGAKTSVLDTYTRRVTEVSGAPDIGAAIDGEDYCVYRMWYTHKLKICDLDAFAMAVATTKGSIGSGQRLYSNGHGLGSLFWARANNRD